MSSLPVNRQTALPGFQETDNTAENPGVRAPLVLNMDRFGQVTRQVCQVAESKKPPFAWYAAFAVSLGLVGFAGLLRQLSHLHWRWRVGLEQSRHVGV